jgi:hypothetical protein
MKIFKFDYHQLNKEKIDKKAISFAKQSKQINKIKIYKKYLFYFLIGGFSFSYLYFALKSTGLLKALKIDEKYNSFKRKNEKRHNVDIIENEKKFKEFEKEWEINKALDSYEYKLKYGNKELNYKNEGESKNEIEYKGETISTSNANENEFKIIIENNKENIDPKVLSTNIGFDSRLSKSFNKTENKTK